MIVLDASVMIAILDDTDAHFSRARDFFHRNVTTQFSAHRLTVAEALVQPTRAGKGSAVASALAGLGIRFLDGEDDPLALAEIRANTGLRMPDCCVLAAAIREHAAIATFDAALAAAARPLGIVASSI